MSGDGGSPRASDAPRVEVEHRPDEGRYVLLVDGEQAGLVDYEQGDGRIVAYHTEVDPERGGRGYGNRLVRGMLDDLRRRGLQVVPACSFVAQYLRRHPEDADLRA